MDDKIIARSYRLVVVSLVLGIVALVLFVSPFLRNFFRMLLVMLALLGCGFSFYVLGKNIAEDHGNRLKRIATFSFALNIFLIVMTLCLSLLGPKVSIDYSVISSSLPP